MAFCFWVEERTIFPLHFLNALTVTYRRKLYWSGDDRVSVLSRIGGVFT
jgi:hypothetical protein